MSFLPFLDDTTLLAIVILIFIIVLVVIFLAVRRKPGREPVKVSEDASGRPIGSLDYKPELQPVKETRTPSQSPGVSGSAGSVPRVVEQAPVKEIELMKGRADITGSLRAMAEKYSLDQFTIATKDGLVFASTGSENAQNDAAVYSGIYSTDPGTTTPGIVLFELVHKNSGLIGIIRTNKPVSSQMLGKIAADTKDILNWWI